MKDEDIKDSSDEVVEEELPEGVAELMAKIKASYDSEVDWKELERISAATVVDLGATESNE